MGQNDSHIVFYDGICGLCNKLVQFLIRKDKTALLKFAPLNGETAHHMLPGALSNIDSIIYIRKGKTHTKSGGALHIFYDLGGLYSLLIIFWIVPYPIRDWVYDKVAKNRYKRHGKFDTCPMPKAEQQHLFLN